MNFLLTPGTKGLMALLEYLAVSFATNRIEKQEEAFAGVLQKGCSEKKLPD